ncbi:Bug family tripartite tricarboxylate transporter substrate binding protein [Ottowia thiooxydans]|uniref:Bug family tripartite tricarboxylate transporter substrate binding protein n=1 Tax=Ottowia thiooxydans TaxID=219182 RepID=UPI0003F927E2|nr:tripartite tricarboxylate transporter substrate binding protein [Ottowia thiooxydans]
MVVRREFIKTLGLGAAFPVVSFSQEKISHRPIRVVVPLPAGSSTDAITRAIMDVVGSMLGQPIVVDNKPGGNGIVAAMDVVRAAPDGLTLFSGSLSALATNVAFVKNLPYDPRRSFSPIANATAANHVLMVKADSPLRNFQDFIAHAKKNSGKVNIGSSTTFVNLVIATLNKVAGIQTASIPYKGVPATVADVIGGVLDSTMADPVNAIAQVQAGRLRALAVTSAKRMPTMPDCPAIAETYPGYDFTTWNGFVGPAGMPLDQVNRIATAIAQALKQPELIKRLDTIGMPVAYMDPIVFKTYIESEVGKYIRLAKEVNIQPE